MSVCTCRWSPVNTATIDPPHVVADDPACPVHHAETDADIFDDDEMAAMTERLVERLERMLDKAEAELERLRADNKLLVERVLELELELSRGCR